MIEIRPVRQEDFPAWQVLWDGYNAFYGRAGDTRLATEIIRMTWSRFFDSYEPVHALVAERAGSLLGLAHFIFHRSTIHIGPLCFLQDLFTAQAARGQGVGRALIEADVALDVARAFADQVKQRAVGVEVSCDGHVCTVRAERDALVQLASLALGHKDFGGGAIQHRRQLFVGHLQPAEPKPLPTGAPEQRPIPVEAGIPHPPQPHFTR